MNVIHSKQWYLGTAAERAGYSPPSDAVGAVFYETDTANAYMWTGSVWVFLGGEIDAYGTFNAGEVAYAVDDHELDGDDYFHWDATFKELLLGASSAVVSGSNGIQIMKEGTSPGLFSWYWGTGIAMQYTTFAARGTRASPSQNLANDIAARIRGRFYHSGGGWSLSKAVINLFAAEDMTASAQGTGVSLQTTKTGTTTTQTRIQADDYAKLGGVDAGNYLRVDDDGQMRLIGDARTHQEQRLEASQSQNGSSAPTSAFRQVGSSSTMLMPVKQFSKVTQQDIYFIFHYAMEMDFTEPVHFHLMWIPGASYTTGNYVWKLEYVTRNETTGVVNAGGSTTISVDVTPDNAYTFIESEFPDDITLGDDEMLLCHLYRDVASDNADDVGSVLFVELNYIVNSHGEPI